LFWRRVFIFYLCGQWSWRISLRYRII
jgi:hypothetical protein